VILAQVTPGKSSTSPFDAGLADRRAYEEWFASLTGDFKRGVEYWAGQRSLERPGSCYLADGTSAGEWTQGCVAAQRQFAPSDVRRKAEPDYRRGWNAYSPGTSPAPAATATPPAAEPSRAYAEGLADRQAWEHYFSLLSGPEKEGAEWWAAHRSDPNNPSCSTLKAERYQNPKVGEVVAGCLQAKRQLDPTDKRRLAEPAYRQGWRSYTEPAASQPTVSAPVASTRAAENQRHTEAKAAEDERIEEKNNRWETEMKNAVMTAMFYDPHVKYEFGSGFLSVLDLTLSSLNAPLASNIADKLCVTYHLTGDLRVYLVDGRKAAQCTFRPAIEPTAAPVFDKPPDCDRDEKALKVGLKALIQSHIDACARDHCPDDTDGQLMSYVDEHTSQSCKTAKAAHLAAWKQWYDSATPEERERQKKNTGGACGPDWPISCAHGF
jgi:hypothetical protein